MPDPRAAQTWTLDQSDQLLADEMVPESAFRRGRQLAKIIAHRRVDAERAIGLPQNEVTPDQTIENLAERFRIQHRQRTACLPFLLVKPAQFANPPQDAVLDRQSLQALLDAKERLHDVGGSNVLGGQFGEIDPALFEKRQLERFGRFVVRKQGMLAELVVSGDQIAKPFLIMPW